MEDFVFIDDNPVEIEEVKSVLPSVTCIQFPKDVTQLPIFLDQLHCLFPIENVTKEDSNRTELYKKMKKSSVLSSTKESDITSFLKSLSMEMDIYERDAKNNDRAVQLINKTNQFNLNGIRRPKEDCDRLLANGARLITANLKDKNGDHGEVLVILIDKNSRVLSFVMSCRIFQRQAEFIFLSEIFNMGVEEISMNYLATERNEPFRLFLLKFFDEIQDKQYKFNSKLLSDIFPNNEKLFTIKKH